MVLRRLIASFSLAALVATMGASAVVAQSPNAGCQAHVTHGFSSPGEVQRDEHLRAFGLEVSTLSRWPGSSLEECLEVFGG